MKTTPALGKAQSYIDVEVRGPSRRPTPYASGPEGPFLTVSREAGTGGVANGVNIRLVGSVEARARRVAGLRGCSHTVAMAINRKVDGARRDYVRSAFDRDIADNSTCDLILNTDSIATTEAVEIVTGLLARRVAGLRDR